MIGIVPKTWHSLFKNNHINYAHENKLELSLLNMTKNPLNAQLHTPT
jgi:hypothetical protein